MSSALVSPADPAVAPSDRLVTLPAGVPDLTLGWAAAHWAMANLRQPNGPRAGQPWRPVDSQLRFLLHWYAVDEAGAWLYHHGVRRLSKGSGKALALNMPIPTPTGWTTMEKVQVGDQLLDEHGKPCNIIATTEAMTGHDCYRVSFRDGTSVVADADHLWPLLEFVGGRQRIERTVTTRDVAIAGVTYDRTRTAGKTKASSDGVARWRTLATPSLDLPEVAVPLPPYVLGYWLGDGDSDAPRVTVSEADLPAFAARAEALGVHLGVPKVTGNPGGTTYRLTFLSGTGQGGGTAARQTLAVGRNALKALGVWRNKHIPAQLLRGSRTQRLELLRGLMDSDGSADANGRIELSLCNQRLAAGAVELMRTLGLYPRMRESDATVNGRVVGRRWRINVTAYADEPIFTLPRKVARLLPRGHAIPYSQVRTITTVEKVPSVPVRCVTVDSPSSLYLAGRGMVPTHNSPFAAVLALVELCAPVRLAGFDVDLPGGCRGRPVDMPLVQIAATAESQTANTMRMVRAFAAKGSKVVAAHGLDPGRTVYHKSPEGTLQVITSSSTAAEGAEASFVVGDEALALGTMVPTPTGWSSVGALDVGDRVFGSNGPVTVTHVTPVFDGRPCYRVTFADGTDLVADEGHLWESKVLASAAKPRVRTTREMAEDGRMFGVPLMRPFDGPDVGIPLDPYVLGMWLGDGSCRWAALTVGDTDLAFVLSAVRERGVPAAKATKYGEKAVTVSLQGNAQGARYTKDGSSVRGALAKLGVLGNKHIPAHLLRASLAQRLDLLRGLMDSDGSIRPSGSAVFVNSNEKLVEGVTELIRTLGYTAHVTSRVDTRWPSQPVVWKVSFRPDADTNPFLLPRKASRVEPPSRRRHKTIISVERLGPRPVRCIEVDATDHLFVAGDGWTLTHNTEHWKPSNGGPGLAATLGDNLAKSGSRMLETCNSWEPGIGSVAEASWDGWVAQEEGRTRGRSRILYDARVAPPDTDMADEASLTAALTHVYDDCFWVDLRPIIERIWDPRTSPDASKRKYLNWPTAPVDAWLTPQEWSLLAAPDRKVADGEDVVLFFDGSKSRDATALVGCCVSDGHVFTVGAWEPDTSHDARSVVPVVEVDATVAWAFRQWRPLAFFADVKEWESFAKVTWPDMYGDRLQLQAVPGGKDPQAVAWDMRTHVYDFTMAVELAETEIRAAAFGHDGDPRMARHVGNARRKPNRWGVSIGKESPDSARKVDLAVAMVGARMVRRLLLANQAKTKRRTGHVW